MAEQPHLPNDPPPLSQQTGLICIRCEYSLAGLSPDGVCPECGASIEHSLHGNRIDFADPEFIASLAKGAALLKFSANCVVTLIIVALSGMILSMILSFAFSRDMVEVGWGIAGVAAIVLGLIAVATWLRGSLYLLIPEPNGTETQRVTSARRAARTYAKVACISIVLLVTAQFAFEALGGDATIFSVIVFVPALAFFMHFQGLCTFTTWLARRIPDLLLVKNLRRARIMAVAVALWSLSPVLRMLADSIGIGFIGAGASMSLSGSLVRVIWSIGALCFILSPLFWLTYTHTSMSRLSKALQRAREYSALKGSADLAENDSGSDE